MSLKITYVLEPFGVLIVFYDDDGEHHQHEERRTHWLEINLVAKILLIHIKPLALGKKCI